VLIVSLKFKALLWILNLQNPNYNQTTLSHVLLQAKAYLSSSGRSYLQENQAYLTFVLNSTPARNTDSMSVRVQATKAILMSIPESIIIIPSCQNWTWTFTAA
jgi:hypothetical protein